MLILTQLQPIAVIFTLPEDQLPTVAQHMKNSTLKWKLTAATIKPSWRPASC